VKLLIAGIDGYLGYGLARWLATRDDVEVAGVDGGYRREWVHEVGGRSVTPLGPLAARITALEGHARRTIPYWEGDLRDPALASHVIGQWRPDAVVQFAECPSAPYSMIDADHCRFVQTNNLLTTFNLMFAVLEAGLDTHFVKLGTMGEYGTPGIPIPEGSAPLSYRGTEAVMPFPRQAGSWYHWSKVHGSHNLSFASRLWGLRVTDVMQGVVFGVFPGERRQPSLETRLDIDAVFGTAVHRWCAQAVADVPLSVYGRGGQRRGFIPLEDSLRCIELILRNPAEVGQYRVVNQLDEIHRLCDLAQLVASLAEQRGLKPRVEQVPNPRLEQEEHTYEVECSVLPSLGYQSRHQMPADLDAVFDVLMANADVVRELRDVLSPSIQWQAPPRTMARSNGPEGIRGT
jgi:UDP-sulfoquinovose synthase